MGRLCLIIVNVKREPGEQIDEARRRLARLGVWAVPTILSVVYVRRADAQQSPSCNPYVVGMQGIGNMGSMSMGMNDGMGMGGN
jgi:hypothetical protein